MRPIRILSAFILILSMSGPSCDKFNLNTDDLDIRLDMNIIKTTMTVQLVDAASGELIGFNDNKQVKINVFGPDSQWVVNTSGEYMKQFFTSAGYMTAGLDPYNAKPTPDDPVQLTLVAQLDGYLSTSMSLTLIGEGSHDYVINMVNTEAPPEGVSIAQFSNVGSSSSGKIDENIEVSTKDSEVSVKLNEGTDIRDEAGNPLQGKLAMSIAYFNPTKSEALSSFPGGLSVDVNKEDNSKAKGAFYSAGFVAIDIKDENGNQASKFSGGTMDLDLAVDENIKNPESGQSVQAGDRVPLWSYDDKTGKWAFEKTVEIRKTPSGLRTNAQMQHLSYWNLDWFESACAFIEIFFTTTDASKAGESGWGYGLQFVATLTGSNEFRSEGYFSGYPELTGIRSVLNTEVLQSVPLNQQVTITFLNQPGTTPLWNLPDPITYDFCASTPVEVPLTPNPDAMGGGGSSTLTIRFTVEIYCTDQGTSASIPDGILLRYRPKGSTTWCTVTASGGTVTIAGLEQNMMYEVQALYNGEWVPDPAFEYFVDPSSQTEVSKNLRFELACGG
ncbi:MAG: hypothetical protein V2A67_05220 [Bacteroidota bacterium]